MDLWLLLVLAFANKVVVNTALSMFGCYFFFFTEYLHVQWLHHMIGVGLIIQKLLVFPEQFYHLTVPTSKESFCSISSLSALELMFSIVGIRGVVH